MLEKLLHGQIERHFPLAEDDEAACVARDLVHVVRDDDDRGGALLFQAQNKIENLLFAVRIKPRRRLVQNEYFRFHHDHARDRRAALLSSRKLEGCLLPHLVRIKPHKAQRLPRHLFRLLFFETHILGTEGDVFDHSVVEKLIFGILKNHSYGGSQRL